MTKRAKRLTSREVETAKEGMHADGDGLYLQVKGGGRSWVYRYSVDGRDRQMGLGATNAVGLAEARELARRARQDRLNGIDPIEARKQRLLDQELKEAKDKTFSYCAKEFEAQYLNGWRPSTLRYYKTALKHLEPKLGHVPISKIDVGLLRGVLYPLYVNIPPTAKRAHDYLLAILDWARSMGLRTGDNPASRQGPLHRLLPKYTHKHKHHPSLPWQEIGKFVARLREQRNLKPDYSVVPYKKNGQRIERSCNSYAVEMVILTAARAGQVGGMRWADIDMEKATWLCPPELHKTGSKTGAPHEVFLNEPAMAILRARKAQQEAKGISGDYVFTAEGKPGKPLTGVCITQFLTRGHGHTLRKGFSVENFRLHGFRATFSSWAHEHGYEPRDIQMALGHVVGNTIDRSYNYALRREKQRRELMKDWADHCNRIEPLPVQSADIIPMPMQAAK